MGILFAFSGLAKLLPGFPNSMGPKNLEELLAPHGLALFARFVALSQAAVGLLLLTRRFATLGALMLLPMLLSILVATVSMQWRGTPYVNTAFVVLNLALLLYDFPKLLPLLGERLPAGTLRTAIGQHRAHGLWMAGLGSLLVVTSWLGLGGPSGLVILLFSVLLLVLLYWDWRSMPAH